MGFGAVGIGQGYWWDYGQLKLYRKNNLLATEDSVEAAALRSFLCMPSRVCDASKVEATVDAKTCICASSIQSGKAENSVIANCRVADIDVTDSVLVNVTAKRVVGKNLVLYNVCDESEEGLVYDDGKVRADCFLPAEKLELRSSITTDGGDKWKEALELNKGKSFEDMHKANA